MKLSCRPHPVTQAAVKAPLLLTYLLALSSAYVAFADINNRNGKSHYELHGCRTVDGVLITLQHLNGARHLLHAFTAHSQQTPRIFPRIN